MKDVECPNCGQYAHSHWRYCPHCGTGLFETDD